MKVLSSCMGLDVHGSGERDRSFKQNWNQSGSRPPTIPEHNSSLGDVCVCVNSWVALVPIYGWGGLFVWGVGFFGGRGLVPVARHNRAYRSLTTVLWHTRWSLRPQSEWLMSSCPVGEFPWGSSWAAASFYFQYLYSIQSLSNMVKTVTCSPLHKENIFKDVLNMSFLYVHMCELICICMFYVFVGLHGHVCGLLSQLVCGCVLYHLSISSAPLSLSFKSGPKRNTEVILNIPYSLKYKTSLCTLSVPQLSIVTLNVHSHCNMHSSDHFH